MLMTNPYGTSMAERSGDRPNVFIPTIYEKEKPRTLRWEYHVLTIDAREAPLPDSEQLNGLGQEGWLLVGVLDERATGRGTLVYYYFTRQIPE